MDSIGVGTGLFRLEQGCLVWLAILYKTNIIGKKIGHGGKINVSNS